MALEPTLQKELEKEIEAEVEALRRRAREQGEAMLVDAERWVERRIAEADARLEEECRLRESRILARTELARRNALLRLRSDELDTIFREAAQLIAAIRDADPEAYQALLEKIFENCRDLLPKGELKVRLGPGLEELRKRLAEREDLEVETVEGLFGLVVEAGNGRLRCDGTIPCLLQRMRQERESDLEEILFGERS